MGDEVADEGLDLGLGGGVGGNLMIFEGEIGSFISVSKNVWMRGIFSL